MWRARDRLDGLNADVLVLSFEDLDRIHWYLGATEFRWPVLSDPSRAAYRAYGLGRGSLARTWLSPRTLLFYARQLLRGRRPSFEGDLRQLGGDFVIDPAGRLTFGHRSREPADRPSLEAILAEVVAAGRALDR